MTTNFTLRDFFVFLLTGLIFVGSIGILFYNGIFSELQVVKGKYPIVEDITFILTLLVIPTIYLLGHFIDTLSNFLFQIYIYIHNYDRKNKNERKTPKWQKSLQVIFYRQHTVYAIIQHTKKEDRDDHYFNNPEEFWTMCMFLQSEKKYSSAEYWDMLNEFFTSISLIFSISSIIAFVAGNWIFGIIYLTQITH